jgi:hypothetical protein
MIAMVSAVIAIGVFPLIAAALDARPGIPARRTPPWVYAFASPQSLLPAGLAYTFSFEPTKTARGRPIPVIGLSGGVFTMGWTPWSPPAHFLERGASAPALSAGFVEAGYRGGCGVTRLYEGCGASLRTQPVWARTVLASWARN